MRIRSRSRKVNTDEPADTGPLLSALTHSLILRDGLLSELAAARAQISALSATPPPAPIDTAALTTLSPAALHHHHQHQHLQLQSRYSRQYPLAQKLRNEEEEFRGGDRTGRGHEHQKRDEERERVFEFERERAKAREKEVEEREREVMRREKWVVDEMR